MYRTEARVAGRWIAAAGIAWVLIVPAFAQKNVGVFQGQQDIGTVLHPGAGTVDASTGKYTISGSGENMWFGTDDFHFMWKRLSGDVALTADVDFVGATGNNHRKAALMLRQSLDPESAYVDVARHGDGLTSLQYRQMAGANTHEVESAVSAPHRVRIEKRGSFAYLFTAEHDGPLLFSGATIPISLEGDFYVGLGVCSHDKDVTETVVFSNVGIEPLPSLLGAQPLWSAVETVKVASTDRLVAYTAPGRFGAPVWGEDGGSLLFQADGSARQVMLKTGIVNVAPAMTGPAGGMDVTSPDGKMRASVVPSGAALNATGKLMEVRTASIVDGKEKVLAEFWSPDGARYAPSWSPDGTRIAFVSFARIAPR